MIIIMQLLLTFNCKNQTKSILIKLCVTVGVTPALVTHVSRKITEGEATFFLLVPCHPHTPPTLPTEGQVTFPLATTHPPDSGVWKNNPPPAATPPVMEGHVIFPLLLPHPSPDYRRTSYISPPAATSPNYGKTSYSKTILPFFWKNLAPEP